VHDPQKGSVGAPMFSPGAVNWIHHDAQSHFDVRPV
jgi:hypothetical protein